MKSDIVERRPTLAFLFPGQGSKGLYEAVESALEAERGLALLTLALPPDLESPSDLLLRGGRVLERTEVYQPVITAVCLSIVESLSSRGVVPDILLGHSLGEVAAWSVGGGMDAERAVRLAKDRGEIMARAAVRFPGGMLALRGVSEAMIAAALERGRAVGVIAVAVVNAPDEVVLSGDPAALVAAARGTEARRVEAPGPWHTSLMADAEVAFRRAISRHVRPGPTGSSARFISNRDGAFASGEAITDRVGGQLTRPVQWGRCLDTLAESGVTHLVTIGPGAVLRWLVDLHPVLGRRGETAARKAALLSTENARDIDKTVRVLQDAAS